MELFSQINEMARMPNVLVDLGRQMKEEILKVGDEGAAKRRIYNMVDGYYGKEIWSTEKDEWERLSTVEKDRFVDAIYNHLIAK